MLIDYDMFADQVRDALQKEHGLTRRDLVRHEQEINDLLYMTWLKGREPAQVANGLAARFKEKV